MVLPILRDGESELPQGKVPYGHAGTLLTMVDLLILFYFFPGHMEQQSSKPNVLYRSCWNCLSALNLYRERFSFGGPNA